MNDRTERIMDALGRYESKSSREKCACRGRCKKKPGCRCHEATTAKCVGSLECLVNNNDDIPGGYLILQGRAKYRNRAGSHVQVITAFDF